MLGREVRPSCDANATGVARRAVVPHLLRSPRQVPRPRPAVGACYLPGPGVAVLREGSPAA